MMVRSPLDWCLCIATDVYLQTLFHFEDRMLFNTSQVNAEEPDLEAFPLFQKVKCVESVLQPGDMLYIPPKWWHYLRSLDTSFSVSFWWQ
jgi:lysine-specific demethylase 8